MPISFIYFFNRKNCHVTKVYIIRWNLGKTKFLCSLDDLRILGPFFPVPMLSAGLGGGSGGSAKLAPVGIWMKQPGCGTCMNKPWRHPSIYLSIHMACRAGKGFGVGGSLLRM